MSTDQPNVSHGRVAIITGGAGGIAVATAHRLASDGVVGALWDLDGQHAAAAAAQLDGWIAVECDVTDEISVLDASTATFEHFGRIDILINAAGITGPDMPLADYTLSDWRRVTSINLDGTFLCCRAVIPHLLASQVARIVNVSSAAGKDGNANLSAYAAAKAGVMAMTKSLGKELATTSVRVNSITPTVIDTELVQQMSPEYAASVIARIPMGRMGRPDEVAEMIAWMASPACSFTTGATFDLSGGRSTY